MHTQDFHRLIEQRLSELERRLGDVVDARRGSVIFWGMHPWRSP